jgi:VanZ family protein
MEWRDVLVDFLGAAIGLVILSMFPVTSNDFRDGGM